MSYTIKKNKLRLSIVVPVYNVEPYLERCLESILSQTRLPDEIILVDDGSTDGSGKICDDYASRYNMIKIVHKENGGLVSARKAGIRLAQGDYVSYVDSDDWIDCDMYRDLMLLAEAEGPDVITSGTIREYDYHTFDEPESMEPGIYRGEKAKWLKDHIIDLSFFKSNLSIHVYNKLYRTEKCLYFQEKVPDRVNAGEDAALCYPLLFSCNSFVVSGKNYYHYRIRSNSIMDKHDDVDERYRVNILFDYLNQELSGRKKELESIKLYIGLLRLPLETLVSREDHLYPYGEITKKEKIVVYGAGRFGNVLYRFLKDNGYDVAGWIDKNGADSGDVLSADSIGKLTYDTVLIAVLLSDVSADIYERLLALGVPGEKIRRISEQGKNNG